LKALENEPLFGAAAAGEPGIEVGSAAWLAPCCTAHNTMPNKAVLTVVFIDLPDLARFENLYRSCGL
jgi:hypothetical protein